ncbi:Fibrinogen- domains (FReDs) [Branchiostoma belcheri]|nr:Fibrinogen- domains (FReDs) [Branchiostoma belcheri]
MTSKKLSQNGEAVPEGSVGRHGNRWTNGIVLALSGLAAVVSVVTLLFMVREITFIQEQQTAFMRDIQDIRDQQTAFQTDLRDQQMAFMKQEEDLREELQSYLKDQVLQMQLKQKNEAKDKYWSEFLSCRPCYSLLVGRSQQQKWGDCLSLEGKRLIGFPKKGSDCGSPGIQGPASSTEDWRRDDSDTFWENAEMHRRSKRNSESNTVLILGKRSDFGCLSGRPQVTTPAATTAPPAEPDCSAYKAAGRITSGLYILGSPLSGVEVYCDMDTAEGGWTVIQRRMDGSVPFNKNWEEYKHGFGNKNGEYWLGNENIHRLTSHKTYRMRVDMMYWDMRTYYAEYETFRVSGESDQYRLQISGYSGNAGDALDYHNGQRFSTLDRDNDPHTGLHCSQYLGQCGWWFNGCNQAYLNGPYVRTCIDYGCVTWRGDSLKSVSMKIRPQ